MRSNPFHALGRIALDVIAPQECAACDAPLDRDELFCASCAPAEAATTDELPGAVRVVAAGAYEGALERAIHRLKYGSRPDLSRLLGRCVADALLRTPGFDERFVLVPVPLHPKRLAERGYNQSALLAASMARALRWPSRPLALRRTHDTRVQASLKKVARLENTSGAFEPRESLAGSAVVLVDDVVTTGATALACVSAVGQGGGRVIAVACVARVRNF